MEPTATHMRMMTPEYASPEQVRGEAITPLSDIYSLGVLLYELLTGHRAYRPRDRTPQEIARVVCEEEPARPAAEAAKDDNFVAGSANLTPEDVARTRGAKDLDELKRELSGDLERVVMKALRKKPSERYESAAALAEDIANYLENLPVRAESFDFPTRVQQGASPTQPEKRSVAILPLTFINMGNTGDAAESYLGIGLADALILRLSKVARFIVRPTSSVLRFQNETVDAFRAGSQLGVEFVVEGAVRCIGDRVRVTMQLLSVKDRATVWAEKFDEKFTDVLELEDTMSERVARSLVPQLTGEEEKLLQKRGTNDPKAYEAYLRGRFYANEFKEDSLMRSIEMYREAIRLDPDYTLPHVGIADFYVWAAIFGAMPCREAYPAAKEELDYALRVDDTLSEAYALKAFVALLYDWDWAEAERHARRALALNPNYYFAHDAYAHVLVSQGVFNEAITEIQIAESFDPLAPRAKLITSCVFYQSRLFNNGAAKADEAVAMQENSPPAFLHLGNSLTHAGRTGRAVEVLRASARFWESSALPRYMLCHALVADGQKEEARRVLDEVLALAGKSYVKPYFVAQAYAALGEIELAFEWFEKAVEGRDDWMIWFGTDIKLDALRQDPRYYEILRKTNNPIIDRQFPDRA
jgi:serine/threonine-protein kinase